MVRNRKVWGVLGLVLALVVVVGYGQVPLPPGLKYVLTVNHGCTRAAGGKLELFILNNDVHPARNITYQNDPASVGFARPDNPSGPNDPPDPPVGCPGVAYFFPDTKPGAGRVYVLTHPTAPAGTYTFKLCLRKFPPPPPPPPVLDPIVTIGELVAIITPQPGNRCLCPTAFNKVVTLPPADTTAVSWDFDKVEKSSVEFCRVEVWQ